MQPIVRWKLDSSRGARQSGLVIAGTLASIVSVALPMALSAAPLQAQTPADTVPLAPIEVNVLRTPFMNDNAPFAVAVRTEDDLQRGRGGVFIEEALQGMPGVQVQNRFNPAVGERIMIRGFGARAQFGLRGFRVVVDGIPATLPDGQASLDHLDIGSLGRVEVLRGPSSALFGNAGGGVITFESRAASTAPYELEVEAAGGSDGLMRGQLTVSGTAGTTGYLVSAYSVGYDSYRTVPDTSTGPAAAFSTYGGFERLGMNAQVTRPVAGGELAFTVNVLDLKAENPGSRRFQDTAPFSTIASTYLVFRTRKDITQQQAGLRWTGLLGDFDGDFSVYGVHRTVFNPIPADLVDLARTGGGVRGSVGRGYTMDFGELSWRAGVDVDLQSDDRKEFANVGGDPSGAATLDQQETVFGTGAFLQTNLTLPSGVAVLGGVRYDRTRFEAEDRVGGGPDDSGARTMSAFSPSIGVSVPVAGSFNVFGSVSTLFETPTTTELANQPDSEGGFNPDLDPMTGRSFEVGVRGDVGSLLSGEVTAFQTNLKNELIPFEVAGSPGVTYSRNAGTSIHKGIEVTLSAADPSRLVRGDVTYTYTDARFDDYIVIIAGVPTDRGGNQVPGVAPGRLQALLRVTPSIGFAEVIFTAMDDVPANDANAIAAPNVAFAPSYSLVDLRMGVDGLELGGASLSPWFAITNALDEEYIGSIAVNAFGGRFFEPGPGRSFQFGLRASYRGGN